MMQRRKKVPGTPTRWVLHLVKGINMRQNIDQQLTTPKQRVWATALGRA